MTPTKRFTAALGCTVALACLMSNPALARKEAGPDAQSVRHTVSTNAKSASTAKLDRLPEAINLDFRRYQLDNGLTVILNKAKGAKDVYVEVVYRVGSKDEPPGRSGFAHLFEHLMFQGTANRKGEYFTALEGYGAIDINGTTTSDRTNFYQLVAPGALDRVLWLESDRMQHLMGGVSQGELDSQRAVVKNEKRESESGDSFDNETQLLRAYYPEGHPYRHTTIGSMDDLNAATLDDVAAWYKRYYGAANAVLLVSGDIDMDAVAATIEHYFSDVEPGKRVDTVDQWVPTLDAIGRIKAYTDVQAPSVVRTWPLPNDDARDTILLSGFFAMLEARKQDLPLVKRLVGDDGVLEDIAWAVAPAAVASEFELRFDVKKGISLDVAQARLDKEFALLLESEITEADLDAYLESRRIQLLQAASDPTLVPALLLEGEWMHDDPLAYLNHLKLVANAAPQEFKEVARRWLTRPYFDQVTLPGGRPADEAAIAKSDGTVDRSAMPPVNLAVADPVFPKVETAVLGGGTKLVVVPVEGHSVIEGAIAFDLGAGYSNELSAEFLFGFMSHAAKATASLDAEALGRRSRELHASIFPAFGENGLHYRFTSVKENFADVFALASDITKNPSFDAALIKKEHQARIDSMSDKKPEVGIEQLMLMALWGEQHPFGKLPDATRAQEEVSSEGLLAFHQSRLARSNMTVYLAGDISLDEARRLVETRFADWRMDDFLAAADSTPPAQTMSSRIILLDSPGAEQAQITASRLIAPYSPDAAPSQRIANAAIGGGFVSRINLNLREEKGWSYGAYSEIGDNAAGPQIMSIGARVQADKTAESIGEILREIADYTSDRPITAAEFNQARDNYVAEVRSFNLTPSTILEMLIQADLRGAPYDYIDGLPKRYEELTLDKVEQVARDLFKPEGLVWVVNGDLSVIEEPIRALGVAPVEVRNAQGAVIR